MFSRSKPVIRLCCFLAPLAVLPPALAETDLEEVIVQVTRIEKPQTAVPGTVTIIDRQTVALQSQIADDLASVLSRTVPGFAPSSQKLAGRGETLRGRNPLYLIDGVPQHNALRDGQRDGHSLDLAFVDRIEVINGSNAIQGVGATGGVVNTVTQSPLFSRDWQYTVGARLSADDGFDSDAQSYKLHATATGGNEEFAVLVGAALHERGLFIDANGDAVGLYPTQGDIMDSTSLNLFVKAAWRMSDDLSLTMMISDFDLQRNGDFRSVNGDRATELPTGTMTGDPSADVGDPARNEVTTVTATV
ncbi:MAG: iron complex outermembrane receptor protein, partial [Candidatus Azotimanducaceae bacterium]